MSSESSEIFQALSLNIIVLFYFWDLPWGAGGNRALYVCVWFSLNLKFAFMPITQWPEITCMSHAEID